MTSTQLMPVVVIIPLLYIEANKITVIWQVVFLQISHATAK